MIIPNLKHERGLYKEGYRNIAGLDEVGRGAWAGPIVAASVILPVDVKIPGLNDSKLLSPGMRKKLFVDITKAAVNWSVAVVSEKKIDELGINAANLLALEQSVKKLFIEPDFLLVDYFQLKTVGIPYRSVIEGDKQIDSIAAASIVAKVIRDYIMVKAHEEFPQYDFHKHKGYGTDHHHKMIIAHGICDLHRRSFSPIKNLVA